MTLRYRADMMMLLLAAAAASAVPQPSALKTFGDWTVGCDNGGICAAESLVVDEHVTNDNGTAATMSIAQEAGAEGFLAVSIDLAEARAGRYALMIDGRRFTTASATENGVLTFDGAEAAALVSAIVNATTFAVQDENGRTIGHISMAGTSATLRYIDDRQGRAGTVAALVAKGSRKGATVPPPPALPVIRSVPPSEGETFNPTPAEIAALRKQSGCVPEEGEHASEDVSLLDAVHTVILMSCGNGAYNYGSVAFIASVPGGKRTITAARFDYAPGWTTDAGQAILVNAYFNPEEGSLASYAKGRGMGDCGRSEQMVWDGSRFRLIEAQRMDECRGNMNWITVWRATIEAE